MDLSIFSYNTDTLGWLLNHKKGKESFFRAVTRKRWYFLMQPRCWSGGHTMPASSGVSSWVLCFSSGVDEARGRWKMRVHDAWCCCRPTQSPGAGRWCRCASYCVWVCSYKKEAIKWDKLRMKCRFLNQRYLLCKVLFLSLTNAIALFVMNE